MGGFMKKYFGLVCLVFFFFSCNHDNGKTEAQALLPPSNLKAVATENIGELKVTWNQVANNSGYVVSYKNTKSNETKTTTLGKDVVTTTLTGVEGGTEYDISCKAKGDGTKFLDSKYSLAVKATPKAQGGSGPQKLATPANFKAVATGRDGEIELSWKAVQNATSYVISYKKTASTDAKTTQNVDKAEVSYLVSSLENNVEYSFFITAKGDGSVWLDSDESAEVKASTGNKLPAPQDLKVFALNKEGSLYAMWDTVDNNNGYTIKCVAEGETEKLQDVAKDGDYTYLEGLAQGKEYSVSIMTKATSGFSPSIYSEIVKCKTLALADVLKLEKVEIEGQDDIKADGFTEVAVNDDGSLRIIDSTTHTFKVTTEEKTITPRFEGSNPKSFEIYKVEGLNKQKLENNKIKFENDNVYSFVIVAKTNKDMVINYEFEGRALAGSFDVEVLYLKGNYNDGDTPSQDVLKGVTESTEYRINPDLRNSMNLKLNVKRDSTLGENQKFLFMLALADDAQMQKLEFDSADAKTATIEGKKYYYNVLTPDSSGKATVNAKFTLKSGVVEQRKYEFTKSDANTNTDIKAIILGDKEFEPVAMPSSYLAIYVPKSFKKKSYSIKAKFENNATYNLYFYDKGADSWKKVNEESNLTLEGEDDEIMLDVIPEIGDGIYAWTEVTIQIIVGAKNVPDQPKEILMGNTSIKGATTKEKAVAVDFNDTQNITIKLTNKADDEYVDVATLCTIEEFNNFLALSQRDKLLADIASPTEDDFSETEAKEFVLIIVHDNTEGYKDVIYHVWLKKKA